MCASCSTKDGINGPLEGVQTRNLSQSEAFENILPGVGILYGIVPQGTNPETRNFGGGSIYTVPKQDASAKKVACPGCPLQTTPNERTLKTNLMSLREKIASKLGRRAYEAAAPQPLNTAALPPRGFWPWLLHFEQIGRNCW